MKALIFSSLFILSGNAMANDFGLGIILGSPTGISSKLGISPDHAIDAAIAWDFGGPDEFHFHADYLWLRDKNVPPIDNVRLDWYFGVGGRMVFIDRDRFHRHEDDFLLGVRAPIGIGYTFANPRIEVFAEIAAVLNLIESTNIDLEGGLGARFHF